MRVAVRPVTDVTARAVQDYNENSREFRASLDSDPAFLERITVNYIRHSLTDYDRSLAELAGKTGIVSGVAAIREKVYGAIAAAYPDLSDECDRQMRAREVAKV